MESREIKRKTERWAIVKMFAAAFSIGLGLTLYHLAGFAVCLAEYDSSKVLQATLASSLALPILGILQVKLLGHANAKRSALFTFGFLFVVGAVLWAATGIFGALIAPGIVFFSKILSAFSFLSFMQVLRESLPGTQNSGLRLTVIAGFPGAQIAGGCMAPTLFNSVGHGHGAGLGIVLILAGTVLILGFCRLQPIAKSRSKDRQTSASTKRKKSEPKKTGISPGIWIIALTIAFALASSLTGHLYSKSANLQAAEPEQLTRTLALVDAISGVFQLLAMTCLGGRLLRSLGASKCLLVMPAMMMICGVLFVALSAAGLPSRYVFWLAAIAWIGEAVGKSSIQHPAMGAILDLLYDSKARDRLHSTLGTIVQPIAKIIAGSFLVSLSDSLAGDFQTLGIIWLFVVSLWLIAAARLSKLVSYRQNEC